MINQNITKLNQYNLNALINSMTIQEVNGEIVCYANLLIDKASGEILDLSSKVKWSETTISTPVAIKTKSLFSSAPPYLELPPGDDALPSALRMIIEKSFKAFNQIRSEK
ncbi:MAG: hypothetical protein JSS09_09640 [Verrucomicrobia bacterium]|nr:hypothetical protein [Verrucomicrobiota bacterium]